MARSRFARLRLLAWPRGWLLGRRPACPSSRLRGQPDAKDYNDTPDMVGVAQLQECVHNGERQDAFSCFVEPNLKAGTFDCVSEARCLRVVFDGLRAVGVVLLVDGPSSPDYKASK